MKRQCREPVTLSVRPTQWTSAVDEGAKSPDTKSTDRDVPAAVSCEKTLQKGARQTGPLNHSATSPTFTSNSLACSSLCVGELLVHSVDVIYLKTSQNASGYYWLVRLAHSLEITRLIAGWTS